MKKLLFSILGAFMVSTMASAQYVNVKMDDGTYSSFKTSEKTEVSFGAKKGTELAPSGYYSKEEVDEKIKYLEEKNKNLENRLARAERLITTISNNDSRNVGHEYVELAGYKWATENVGKVDGITTYSAGAYGYLYNQENAQKAVKSWGGTWTVPTEAQWKALLDNCYWVWVSDYNGQNGCIVYEAQTDEDKGKWIGPDSEPSEVYTSTVPHIFLPAAGYCNDTFTHLFDQSGRCYYWSSNGERGLKFYENIRWMTDISPLRGLSVRPVSE